MMIHVFQIHKETIETVPGAKEGRDSFDTEIFGMEGVPPEMIEEKRIQMFGAPSTKKQKTEQAAGHPLLSGLPGPELIIPGVSSTTTNNPNLGSMHPARQMMLANVQGVAAVPAPTMPMFGMGIGFPGVPLPLHLPPPPPPKPWPPEQPNKLPQRPQQPPPPKRKPIITTQHGQPSSETHTKQIKEEPKTPIAAPTPPLVNLPSPLLNLPPPSVNLPPPPNSMSSQVATVPISLPTPNPPTPTPVPPVASPAPPAPKTSAPVPTAAAPPVPTVAPPPPESEVKAPPAAEAPPAVKQEPASEPLSPNKKKKKNIVLIYEEKYISQEEKRAMNPKYSAFLKRRIASLSNSIEARLRTLQ